MKKTCYGMLFAFLIASCAPLKQASVQETPMPFLAAVGKQQKSVLHTEFTQVGEPTISHKIALSVEAIPFNNATFKTYRQQKAKKGEQPSIAYIDSLPNKPKYLRFEIKDRIGLKALLNDQGNKTVCSYVAKDSDCKIVTGISLFIDDRQLPLFRDAEGLFLTPDVNGILSVQIVNGRNTTLQHLPKNEIFDYELAGFCWGENQYGRPQVETLTAKGGCPNGTVKKAEKLEDLKLFSKL